MTARRALAAAALIVMAASSTVGTRGLSAQVTPRILQRAHVDTVLFHGDTVLIHAASASARIAGEFKRYIAAMPPLPGLPPHRQPRITHIFLAENEAAFGALTGGAAPHWGAGVAQPDSGIIVLPAYTSDRAGVQDLGPVVRHELAHIELQHVLGAARIPRWFTEGYAVVAAGQLDPDAAWTIRLAFLTNRAPPLDSLELGWPAVEAHARVAYLLSGTAVSYLISLGTDETFRAFLDDWRRSGSFEHALRATYFISSATFESLWTTHVRRQYGWLLFAVQGTVAWLIISLAVVALIFVRRRRDRRRLAELRRTEGPDAPAYWLGIEEDAPQDAGNDAAPEGNDSGRVDGDFPS